MEADEVEQVEILLILEEAVVVEPISELEATVFIIELS